MRRWDHEGCFDVLVVTHGSSSTKPIVIKGDTLSIQGEPCSAAWTKLFASYHVFLRRLVGLEHVMSAISSHDKRAVIYGSNVEHVWSSLFLV